MVQRQQELGHVASGVAHVAVFYETDAFLAEAVADFLQPALVDGGGTLIVATRAHLRRFTAALQARGQMVDPERGGRLVTLEATDTLQSILVGGALDRDRFHALMGPLVDELAGHGGRVRIYGELVALLWEQGNANAALELEDQWNGLAAAGSFGLLCGYPLQGFCGPDSTAGFQSVCLRHSAFANEGYIRLGGTDRDHASAVLVLDRHGDAPADVDRAARPPQIEPSEMPEGAISVSGAAPSHDLTATGSTGQVVADWPRSAVPASEAPEVFDRWIYRRCPEPLTDGGRVRPQPPEALLGQLLGVLSLTPVETSLALGLGRSVTYAHAARALLWARHAPAGPQCPSFRAAYYFLESVQGRDLDAAMTDNPSDWLPDTAGAP